MLANLKWSDTDNFYMNLGCHKGVGLVVCGDDKGSLWLYNCPNMVMTQPEPLRKVVEPSTRLMWPELQDDHLEISRKVPLDRHDIIIDKVGLRTNPTCLQLTASLLPGCLQSRQPARGGRHQQQHGLHLEEDRGGDGGRQHLEHLYHSSCDFE